MATPSQLHDTSVEVKKFSRIVPAINGPIFSTLRLQRPELSEVNHLEKKSQKMTEKSRIETEIEAFVARKTGEAVYVEVGEQDTIFVKHKSIHGSIALSIFWTNVLQHPNNYPTKHFSYKKHYDSKGPYKLVLRTEDVDFSVCMKTGSLSIKGLFVIEWFLKTFLSILSGYESPPGPPRPVKGTFKEIESDYRKVLKTQKRRQVDQVNQRRKQLAERTVADTLNMPPNIPSIEYPEDLTMSHANYTVVNMDESNMPSSICFSQSQKVEDPPSETENIQEVKIVEITESQVEEVKTIEEDQIAEAEPVPPDETQVQDGDAETEDGQTVEGVDAESAADKEQEASEGIEPDEPAAIPLSPDVEEVQDGEEDVANVQKEETEQEEKIQSDAVQVDEIITVTEINDDGVISEKEEEWQEMLSSMDMWPEDILQKELKKLKHPCIKDGSSYIYTLWKSLLNSWFSDQDCKVYIAAPVIDVERLQDICNIFLQHRLTAYLDVMYVTQDLKHIAHLRRNTLDNYDVNEQIFIEYKIFKSMVFPPKNFQARFIAAAKGGKVDILVTSAGFHRDYFCRPSEETIIFQTIDEEIFNKKFMKQLHSK